MSEYVPIILGVALILFVVVGSAIYKPIICAVCDGVMFRAADNKLHCMDCGRVSNG